MAFKGCLHRWGTPVKKIVSALTVIFTAVSMVIGPISVGQACTVLSITDLKGNLYKGRTIEFSGVFPSSLTYMSVGTRIESLTPEGQQGMTFNTKYAILGMLLPAIPGAKQQSMVDGMNDQGLSVSVPAQNNTKAPPIVTKDPQKILSAADITTWMLGNFKSTAEVRAALQSDVEFWLPNLPLFDNVSMPIHFAVFDKTGDAIVLEFMNGKKSVYDNPVGVLTNGPEFPWHLTNLVNYTQSNVDQNTAQFGKLKVATPDAGIAASMLPSSQTAIGRFVKAAYYVNYVKKADTPDKAVLTLGHIMNNFDRPTDFTVDKGTAGRVGDGGGTKGISSEVTDYSVMNDLARNLYYVRSINALNWTVVDFNKIKDVKEMKHLSAYEVEKYGADATSFFLK